jgi:hypothetical protein
MNETCSNVLCVHIHTLIFIYAIEFAAAYWMCVSLLCFTRLYFLFYCSFFFCFVTLVSRWLYSCCKALK